MSGQNAGSITSGSGLTFRDELNVVKPTRFLKTLFREYRLYGMHSFSFVDMEERQI